MKKSLLTLMVGSLIASILLAGCGNSNTPTASSSDKGLSGSVVKGPISDATIKVYDDNGKGIASAKSSDGKFVLPKVALNSTYYIIESHGGRYMDEATQKEVAVPADKGLKTLLSRAEFEDMLANKASVALTPETTIYTALVREKLQGSDLATAMTESEKLVYDFLIKESSPMPGLAGDKFSKRGDLTKAIPTDPAQAFAKNRVISYSTMVKDLGLAPGRVFDVLDAMEEDLKDGKVDGSEIEGKSVKLPVEYGLARTKLFNETTSRLREGNLSDAQAEALKKMGFDIEKIQSDRQAKEQNLSAEVTKYLASDTLPTLHILPTMSDEDGNPNDAAATYTLAANKDVNVTIETPEGSWVTPMWRYNNNPLPLVIRADRGMAMTLNFQNRLDADSTIHWHGFKIPAIMDGGPDFPVAAGSNKAYTFTMQQPAAPLWFHPHPDMQTGKQVYMGLAGVFLLEDAISKKLEADKALPSGDRDVVLLVQDRRFAPASNGVRTLQYKTMEMDSDGMLGDTVLVNGSVMPKLEVGTAQYRLRLYNVSNARNYDFAFHDKRKFKIVSTDGGLLKNPVEVDHITLGAAERVEIIADFSKDPVGTKVLMVSQPTKGDMMGMMGMMGSMDNTSSMNNSTDMNSGNGDTGMNGGSQNSSGMNNGMGGMNNQNGGSGMGTGNDGMNMNAGNNSMGGMKGMAGSGQGLVIMRFDVTKTVNDDVTLYTALPDNAEISARLQAKDAVNFGNERQFVMSMANGGMGNMGSGGMNMNFVINGKTFDMNRVDEFIGANTVEIWNIRNMSPMAHPFHAHAIQYQILDRNGIPASGTDLGWKDTFLVQPGESVRIIGKFDPVNQGDYMYHCHILEHEDAGMMGYFRVGPTGHVGN